MALHAVVVIVRSDVIRILGVHEIRHVAVVAIGREADPLAVCVTLDAGRGRMFPGEGEVRLAVIECSRFPGNTCVAELARRGESIRDVRRIDAVLEISSVAGDTIL